MIIRRIFNNNALLVEDDNKHEVVLLGKGIGFNKHPGDKVDILKIQKRYIFDKSNLSEKVVEYFEDVPENHIYLGKIIVEMAQQQMSIKLDTNVLVAITDHISFSIQIYEEGIKLKNALLWDVKNFYPFEFKLGMMALDFIYYETGIVMEEDEAAFKAMHFVNANYYSDSVENTAIISKMVDDILQIVEYHFRVVLDET